MNTSGNLQARRAYAAAAAGLGAIGLGGQQADAAPRQIEPLGGFPIVCDALCSFMAVDVTNDGLSDFYLHYTSSYGGAFSITSQYVTDGYNSVLHVTPNPLYYDLAAARLPWLQGLHYYVGFDVPGNYRSWVHRPEPGQYTPGTYVAFDGTPGYVGLRVHTAAGATGEHRYACLLVEVDSSAGTMTVWTGEYQNQAWSDLTCGDLIFYTGTD